MSFKRFDQEDIVISAESITAPAWSDNIVTLTEANVDTTQRIGSSGKFYFNIYQTGSSAENAAIQYSIAFGHVAGSGSVALTDGVEGYSPSSIIYKQYRTLINGTEEENLKFNGTESEHIYVIAINRARFKEKLLPSSLTLKLSHGSTDLVLTDDSSYAATTTFSDCGRMYQLVSGSAGVRSTGTGTDGTYGYTSGYGSYGVFLPDAGLIVLSGKALDAPTTSGGLNLSTDLSTNANSSDRDNLDLLHTALINGAQFSLRSEETVSSNYVFVRARNSEFNYSTNPSNITGSGELRHSIMIDTPQAYITAVGLYNDNNDLLAVAKLSRPLLKDHTKESLIRVKLDY